MAVNLLDYEVLHTEWVPQFLQITEVDKTGEVDFLLLGRIFQVCTVTEKALVERKDGVYSKDFKDVFMHSLVDKDSVPAIDQKTDLGRKSFLCHLYNVSCTSPYKTGIEQICDVKLMEKMTLNKGQWRNDRLDAKMKTIGEGFAKELALLHPLSKLKGLNTNPESRSRLPNLEATTEDYADDLFMSVEELLSPGSDYCQTESWLNSRTRICAVIEIMKRLGELN